MSKRLRCAALGAAFSVLAGAAVAQAFPAKPVRIVVPFPPGGGADTLTRLLAPRLTEAWGQQIVVENKPGASGHIGAELVAKSAPDGYTLVMASTAALDERNVVQFAAVALVSASAYVVAVHPGAGAATIRELVVRARENPGKLGYASSGAGAASHLAAELFKSMAGVDLLHVPYKGTGQAVTDLIAGHVQLMFAPAQVVMPHVQTGRLRALAVTGAQRSATLRELPTVAESGVPGYEAVGWFGVLAPAATPQPIVAQLSRDVNRALADPAVRKKMLELGSDPAGSSPEEFARFIRADQAKWAKLMRDMGIKRD